MLKLKKSLGQNLLIDKNIINKILRLTSITNRNVLEIGPGFHSHIDYVKHDYKNYYILEQEKDKLNFHKKRKNNKIKLSTYKKNKMPYKNNFFDRIIKFFN